MLAQSPLQPFYRPGRDFKVLLLTFLRGCTRDVTCGAFRCVLQWTRSLIAARSLFTDRLTDPPFPPPSSAPENLQLSFPLYWRARSNFGQILSRETKSLYLVWRKSRFLAALASKQEQPEVHRSYRNKQNDLTSCFGTFRGIVKTKHFPFDRVRRARFPGWPLPFRLHSYTRPAIPARTSSATSYDRGRSAGEDSARHSRTFSWRS